VGSRNTTISFAHRAVACRSAYSVNANLALVTGMSCSSGRGGGNPPVASTGFRFFGYSLGYVGIFGDHRPGITNMWEAVPGGEGPVAPTTPDAAASAHRTNCARAP